jgi:uncharacterized paraquat-inducible protein A
MITLQEKLRSEAQSCPKCHNIIDNPFLERCPRCLTAVPVIDPGCSRCIHNAGCPVSSLKSAESRSGAA